MCAVLRNFDFLKRIIGMILENNRKAFQELQNRIMGKILSIIASSLAVIQASRPRKHIQTFKRLLTMAHYQPCTGAGLIINLWLPSVNVFPTRGPPFSLSSHYVTATVAVCTVHIAHGLCLILRALEAVSTFVCKGVELKVAAMSKSEKGHGKSDRYMYICVDSFNVLVPVIWYLTSSCFV